MHVQHAVKNPLFPAVPCRTLPYSYKRGYKNVISAGVDLNAAGTDCQLMMETSGHGALKENYFLDDGAYLAVKVRYPSAPRTTHPAHAYNSTITHCISNITIQSSDTRATPAPRRAQATVQHLRRCSLQLV